MPFRSRSNEAFHIRSILVPVDARGGAGFSLQAARFVSHPRPDEPGRRRHEWGARQGVCGEGAELHGLTARTHQDQIGRRAGGFHKPLDVRVACCPFHFSMNSSTEVLARGLEKRKPCTSLGPIPRTSSSCRGTSMPLTTTLKLKLLPSAISDRKSAERRKLLSLRGRKLRSILSASTGAASPDR